MYMIHLRRDKLIFDRAKLQNPNVKRIASIVFTAILVVFSMTSAGVRRDQYKIKTVVIDAGHGGHDSGCLGASSKEKHIALDIALTLGKLIETNYPDVKVVYTRKTDVFIPLHERANIANRAHADLFICIHLNSGGKGAYGSETYVMGNHKTEDNLEVAKRENSAILFEDDYIKKYDGFDPNSPEANIIFSLYQSQFMSQSLLLASNIQEEFTDYAGRYNRGVKQAGFLVLYKTAMPAVLIECGFLTHDPEEKYLASDKGQSAMATSIYRAFKAYKLDMESGGEVKAEASPSAGNPSVTEKPQTKDPEPKEVITQTKPEQPVKDTLSNSSSEIKDVVPVNQSSPVVVLTPKPTPKTPAQSTTPSTSPDVFIAIQIGASKNPKVDNPAFLKNEGVRAVACTDGYTRYIIGSFTNSESARKKMAQVKSAGHPDAFLTAFNKNQRIPIPEAEQLLKRP